MRLSNRTLRCSLGVAVITALTASIMMPSYGATFVTSILMTGAGALDTDGDGIGDLTDNCTLVSNANQRDTNQDGFGNACDPDLDNNGIINFVDVSIWAASFNTTTNGDADFNGDGAANFLDYAMIPDFFLQPPGPAAIPFKPLFDDTSQLAPISSFIREDGVVVTRFGDRGRDRHAKDIGIYDPNNIQNSDHYDHWLAHYWEYRTARILLEDHTLNGVSLIRATYITESRLGAKEFRVWYHGLTTTGQFHYNPTAVQVAQGTFSDDFVQTSSQGQQFAYRIDITEQWKNVATFNGPLTVGTNMEFEISQFLLAPPAGLRKNYYGTSYVYTIGTPGLRPFEWQRGVNRPLGVNDGTPIPPEGLSGGDTTLGYNYSEEPAGRFMQMATNLSPGNAQPFVRGRRVHHTNFNDGIHDERADNPVWTEQLGKAGNHYVNLSCALCHVRNGRALVADVGADLDKWVFKVGDANGDPDAQIGRVLQPNKIGAGTSEGTVSLGQWTDLPNGLRSPNYVFSNGAPERFSARIAPQLVGLGLLEAVPESVILEWADAGDSDGDGISGRPSVVTDPETNDVRLGRFGYKASTMSVKHQAAEAFNTDMGVMTSVLPNPDCGSNQTSCGTSGSELADNQLDDLVTYLSLLGVGARRNYDDSAGEELFANAGCGGCHRKSMTTSSFSPMAELRSQTIYPYSDMLLHDMGPGLADNLDDGTATGSEWRTTPLWGLGHSRSVMLGDAKANDLVSLAGSPDDVNRIGFLHDGRARTIDEAIRWHGGEADASRLAYEALSAEQQSTLLDFLNSL
ncbi:MAG: di-heme oxidoredictase family protein [Gammaproteobacteria bacterium]